MMAHEIRWRRLDLPGDDRCSLGRHAGGWRLAGHARFAAAGGGADIHYRVDCDTGWRSVAGRVRGHIGKRRWNLHIVRDGDGSWRVDAAVVPGLHDCDDLDFGFTPATNLPLLRRLALDVGAARDVAVAWLDLPDPVLQRLPQRYRRLDPHRYAYESPTAGYAATLVVDDIGFARSYPGLWLADDPET
jgi:hypothetical protein